MKRKMSSPPHQSAQPADASIQAAQESHAQTEMHKHVFWQMISGRMPEEDKMEATKMLMQKLMGMGKEIARSAKESEAAKRIKERKVLEKAAKDAEVINPPVQGIVRRI